MHFEIPALFCDFGIPREIIFVDENGHPDYEIRIIFEVMLPSLNRRLTTVTGHYWLLINEMV